MTSDPAAPESEPDRVIDEIDKTLQPRNIPNTLSRWRSLWSMVPGALLIVIGIVISIVIYAHGHHVRDALIVLAACVGAGLLFSVVPGWISYRQLRSFARTPPAPYTHFQTNAATNYEVPLGFKAAVIGPGETVGAWFGPVTNPGMSGSYQALSHEVDKEAINTLLFTDIQVIGLMLGPDDLRNLSGSGTLTHGVNVALKYVGEGGYAKGVQFQALNANHWDEMVSALTALPLETALQNHLNFGLPYGRIQSVEVKHHLVNPGFTFRLTDGSHIRYGTFKRDRLPEIASYLKQFVTVQSTSR
jgi:hypothetical protein